MSESLTDASTSSFLLDGDLPRLGSVTPAPAATPAPFAPPASPPQPGGPGPVLTAPVVPSLPTLPTGAPPASAPLAAPELAAVPFAAPDLPTLPTVAPAVHQATEILTEATASAAEDQHPMAHLMPQMSAPSEASRRAAEKRAAKKAKARKVKIWVAVGALVFTAVVGPPVGKWVVNAINESGSTSTDVDE